MYAKRVRTITCVQYSPRSSSGSISRQKRVRVEVWIMTAERSSVIKEML
jgi:hypothetical protein